MREVRLLGTFVLAASLALGGLVGFGIGSPVSAQEANCSPSTGAALQAAVDGCAEVVLADGDYEIPTTLVVSKNVTITGVGNPGAADPNVLGGSRIRLASSAKGIGVVSVGGTNPVDVTINGVTIMDGKARGNGGGISVASNATLRLTNSTVRRNTATEGAGIDNLGKLFVTGSTFLNNVASKKGGGIRSQGSVEIVNSTFQGNSASQGGAISTPGSGKVVHSTITKNFSTSSSSAGIDRNGGSLQVFYSIIGDNTRTNMSPAADCSGTPDLIGYNIVTDLSGCNPVGTVVPYSPADLKLGELSPLNGGPTLTRALLDGSPALDKITRVGASGTDCVSTALLGQYGLGPVDVDQRGTSRRSAGDGCDVGSFELARFGVENFVLDVDTSMYPHGPGKVEVGVTSVSVDDIANALNAPAPASATSGTVQSSGVRNVGVRNVTVQNIGVRNVGVRNVGVRNVGVRNVGVRNVGVRNVGVRNVDLKALGIDTFITSVPLSEIPLLASATDGLGSVPEGWAAYLKDTQYDGLPLQSLTLETLAADPPAPLTPGYRPFDLITLEDLDLTNSVLGAIELRSAALADVPLKDIPLALSLNADGTPIRDANGNLVRIPWCDVFSTLCERLGGGQIGATALGNLDLLSVQLAGEDVDTVDAAAIDLKGTLAAIGVRNVGVRNVGVRNVTLFSLGVRNVNLQNSGVRNVGVRNVGVRNVTGLLNCPEEPAIDSPLYCQDVDANNFTLGTLPDTAFRTGATVGDLIDALNLGLAQTPTLLDGMSLADFLALFAPNAQVPWEKIDLEGAQLQNFGDQKSFDYLAKFTVTGSAAQSLEVKLTIPKGFVLATRTPPRVTTPEVATIIGGALGSPVTVVPTNSSNGGLKFTFPATALAPGNYVLRVPALAGIKTGDYPAEAQLIATGATGTFDPKDQESVTVVPAPDLDATAPPASPKASALDFGDLQLAHIAQSGDVDLYEFVAPTDADGATAQVLLSNVPDGVDYDLSIYAPTDTPLRGAVGDSAGARKSVDDIRYDLDPGDDVFPTDIADDINLDALSSLNISPASPYVLRDISSRRSNSDEEVEIPALQKGKKYYVAVTAYLGDFSNAPYAIRLRTDAATALPVCRAGDRIVGSGDSEVNLRTLERSTSLGKYTVPVGTNTLYVTNLEWLAATFPGQYQGIVTAALDTGKFVGSTVKPAIVDVSADSTVRDAYVEWATAANRCDPDYRNKVVRAIGALLDGIQVDDPATTTVVEKVENVVILGDDGIVPMAAVPDLTGYSNEATFARDVLTNGSNNEVAGALGSGYLLSDDPYGTSAGIDIRNAGHQLYVPEVSVGRLVETGEQILDQLVNFSSYKGRLDPGTLPVSSAVAGYDFLTDGATALAQNLDVGSEVTTSISRTDGTPVDLLGDTWTGDDYLKLLDADPDIVSPNAHYDYEALLPAAADSAGSYSNNDLVFTSDVVAKNLDKSLLFTMGCHAGLSVSDVQLGFSSLDWAQSYAGGDNQWIAHTTYGYGDDQIVAYSERLAALFADNVSDHLLGGVDAPTSLGQAMLLAKQEYLATTFTLTPYDEKILQSWTYYGLPMYEIGGGTADTASGQPAAPTTTASSSTPPPPSRFGTETTDAKGMAITPYSASLNRTVGRSGPNNLNLVKTDDGNYYEVGGNTVTAQHRPVQPLVSDEVPDGIDAAGFLITGLTSTDVRPFSPLYLRPTVDLSGIERRVEPLDGSFPSNLQLVTDDGAGSQHLLLAAGQFQSGDSPGSGIQRLYTSIKGDLYHSNPANPSDGIGPRFLKIDTSKAPVITVTTADPAKQVVVLYQPRNQSNWLPLPLVPPTGDVSGKTWTGSLPSTDPTNPDATVEFLVQALDAQGDVSISDNKVENFFNSGDPDGGPLTIEAFGTNGATANDAGYFKSNVTVTISAASADDFDYVSLDGIEMTSDRIEVTSYPTETDPTLTLSVTGDGPHVIFARDSSGSGQIFSLTIDATPPTITSPTTSPTSWSQGPVTVDFEANDPLSVNGFSSGVGSITYMVDGVEVEPSAPGQVTVPRSGVVSAYATDLAGNRSLVDASVTVRIDNTAPTVDIATVPTEGWAQAFNVILSDTSQMGLSPTTFQFKTTPVIEGEAVQPGDDGWLDYDPDVGFQVTTEATAIWARATDEALNRSAVAGPVIPLVDTTPPTWTVSFFKVQDGAEVEVPGGALQQFDEAYARFTCDDEGRSGVKACPDRVPLDTSSIGPGTATVQIEDNVGNETTASAPYSVGYRVCELYDSTKPANPGSNYTIKVQFCDAQGRPTPDNGSRLLVLTAIEVIKADGTEYDILPSFSGGSNAGYEFRYSARDKQYVYNLSTSPEWGVGDFQLGFVVTVGSITDDVRKKIDEDNGSTNFAGFTLG